MHFGILPTATGGEGGRVGGNASQEIQGQGHSSVKVNSSSLAGTSIITISEASAKGGVDGVGVLGVVGVEEEGGQVAVAAHVSDSRPKVNSQQHHHH